jgi:hypothetical protein
MELKVLLFNLLVIPLITSLEIFIFCVAHANKVQEHIKYASDQPSSTHTPMCYTFLIIRKSSWSSIGIKIETIVKDRAQSEGDALREMSDTRLLHKEDFVLVAGDVIGIYFICECH